MTERPARGSSTTCAGSRGAVREDVQCGQPGASGPTAAPGWGGGLEKGRAPCLCSGVTGRPQVYI